MTAADLLAMGYRPYAELPPEYKDGRLVLLRFTDSGWLFPMRWNESGHDIVYGQEKVGLWELDGGGGLTLTDADVDDGATWWTLPEADEPKHMEERST